MSGGCDGRVSKLNDATPEKRTYSATFRTLKNAS